MVHYLSSLHNDTCTLLLLTALAVHLFLVLLELTWQALVAGFAHALPIFSTLSEIGTRLPPYEEDLVIMWVKVLAVADSGFCMATRVVRCCLVAHVAGEKWVRVSWVEIWCFCAECPIAAGQKR